MANIKITEEQALQAFVTQMLKDKGVLSSDYKEAARQKRELESQLMDQIYIEMVGSLDDDKLNELEDKIDGISDDELDSYFSDELIDNVTAKVMADFRRNFLAEGAVA